jgi:HD-GYP domain-containing protein (c-di-GMP phosphodiesterase class II)
MTQSSEFRRGQTDAHAPPETAFPANADGVATEVRLMRALREFDDYTAEHCEETVALATRVALRMGAQPEDVAIIARVARLHDIGKLGVPREILLKPGPLDLEEQALMRAHTRIGRSILEAVPALADVAFAVLHEHERWDGHGYPDGIAGEEIPLASRIVLACDAWQAMNSRRPYRRPLAREQALAELERGAGTQFDPDVVEALLGLLTVEDPRAA